MKSLVPDFAMVPKLSMASCWLKPIPLSEIVKVLSSLFKLIRTCKLGHFHNIQDD